MTRRRPSLRWLIATACAAALCVAGALAAWAWWSATSNPGGSGSSVIATVGQGARPTLPASGGPSVAVAWSAATLSNGRAVDGYTVTRYDNNTDIAQTVVAGCVGTVATTGCTETGVPQGVWVYTVTPVIGANWKGLESPKSTTFTYDTTAPAGGSIDAANLSGTGGRYATSLALTLVFTKGSDAGSGLATSGAQVLRAMAALTSNGTSNGACGAYGAFSQVGANDPLSGMAATVPTDAKCYRYQYVVADKAGNVATYTSPDVKIDTTAPSAPIGGISGLVNASWNGAQTVYYRPTAPNGSFTLNAVATDAVSGIASFTFPTLPAGWAAPPGALGVLNYSYSAPNPTQPAPNQSVTAVSNAGLQSPLSSGFTVLADSTVPVGATVSYTNGYATSTSASVSFTQGSDAGSGLNDASDLIQRAAATLTAGSCGVFGGFATVATNPTSPFIDTVSNGSCYQYRYVASDNVGNQATFASASVLKVDTTAPTVTAIASQQSTGAVGNGDLAIGDKLILTFNQDLATASVPTSFTGATETRASGGHNVFLAIPGITDGSVDTGSAGYLTGTTSARVATFNGTVVLANHGTTTTVTITVTTLTGDTTTASAGVLSFRPAISINDDAGNDATGTFATPATFKLF